MDIHIIIVLHFAIEFHTTIFKDIDLDIGKDMVMVIDIDIGI